MTKEELKREVYEAMKNKPSWSREGQFVFNYINEHYRVARTAQFDYGIDCFYLDHKIDEFIEVCAKLISMTANDVNK